MKKVFKNGLRSKEGATSTYQSAPFHNICIQLQIPFANIMISFLFHCTFLKKEYFRHFFLPLIFCSPAAEQADSVLSQDFKVRGQTRILRCEVVEGGGSGVQDIFPMKPRFRSANLLITHVLDQCVKLLAVLHISSAQGRSVDLSVEITTGRRRMIDII